MLRSLLERVMTQPGKGWARRVTSATLHEFRTLLRTGIERAAEAREDTSNEPLADDPTSAGTHASDPNVGGPDALFDGTSIVVPSQYRAHRQNATVPPNGAPVTPGTITRQPSASPAASTGTSSLTTARRWSKRMSPADAQRPRSQNTNPTGHLTLVQSGHPIEQATWFHDDLFAGADWNRIDSPSGPRERATIAFHMRIEQDDLGEIALEVTYTPSFEAQQGNRTTVVHWGTMMGNRFRQHDYTDYYVTIERTTSGTFLMVIDDNPTGPFVD